MAATIALEIVTIERQVYEAEEIEMLIAPGVEGEMGILPRHTPTLTALKPGELFIRHVDGTEEPFAIGGGFMEVRPDKIIVLADTAEHVAEIDIERAEQARERAERLLREGPPEEGPSVADLRMALERSRVRLKVARRRRRHRRSPGQAGTSSGEG